MSSTTSTRSALIELHIATLLLAGSALFPRLLKEFPTHDIVVVRSVLGAIALVVVALLMRQSFRYNRREAGWVILLGVLMAVHWWTYYEAIQLAKVTIGVISLFTYPIFVVLIEPFFERRRIQMIDLALAGLVFAGVLIVMPEFSLQNKASLGLVIGVFSAVIFAFRNVLQRHKLRHKPPAVNMGIQVGIVGLLMLPTATITAAGLESHWWHWLLLGLIFTAAPHVFLIMSMRQLSAKTVGIISCLTPVYATVIASILLEGETPTWMTIFGGLIVVSVAAFESVRTRR